MSGPQNQDGFSYDIYGGIDAELDRVFAERQATLGASPDLGQMVAQNTLETDSAERPHSFDNALTLARYDAVRIYNLKPENTPNINKLETAGPGWDQLNNAFDAMEARGDEPELLLLQEGGASGDWERLFERLGQGKNVGLKFDDEIKRVLNEQQTWYRSWYVTIIPTAVKAGFAGLDHSASISGTPGVDAVKYASDVLGYGSEARNKIASLHPSIATYLTLQAKRLLHSEPFVGAASAPWSGLEYEMWLACKYASLANPMQDEWSPIAKAVYYRDIDRTQILIEGVLDDGCKEYRQMRPTLRAKIERFTKPPL